MPHGSLPPLGRQLRSVLANLRIEAVRNATHRPVRALFTPTTSTRIRNAWTPLQAASPAPAPSVVDEQKQEDDDLRLYHPLEPNQITEEASPLPEPDQIDGLWASWDSSRKGTASPQHARHKRDRKVKYGVWERDGGGDSPEEAATEEYRLGKLLERYIGHQEATKGAGATAAMPLFRPSHSAAALMQSRGYILGNIRGWAEILSMPDSFQAATKLEKLRAKYSVKAVPIFVISRLLLRSYIGARALKLLQPLAFETVEYHKPYLRRNRDENDIFVLFGRLLRHIRVVWPSAIEILPELLLRNLSHNASGSHSSTEFTSSNKVLDDEQLEKLTHKLNKAMRLIALPTAVEPFKGTAPQETAIVRILSFMAEHDPPLEINREGYRAVTMVQLTQPKSPSDQQWAELKALSWPPWKEERTAMDADITVEEHGRPKAKETLERMREAGYGPREWERVASVYTGWDTDRTPTIQTRVRFGFTRERLESGAALWATRITTTRTVQEAWACYLACEDEGTPPDQEIYLAIFQKLYEDELRQQKSPKYRREISGKGTFRLWPGDTREIEPLPPSAHQYTYTRLPPPKVDLFYRQLRARGIVFEDRCLAFLVAKARTLVRGIEYLVGSITHYPAICDLLVLEPEADVTQLPTSIFNAFLGLLGRFSKLSLSPALPHEFRSLKRPAFTSEVLEGQSLNFDSTLVRAIELLKRRRPWHRAPWNSVLCSLGNESSLQNLWTIVSENQHEAGSITAEHKKWRGAITAFHLTQRVCSLMSEINLDPDIVGFQALCQVHENLAFGCWTLMRDEVRCENGLDSGTQSKLHVKEAVELMRASTVHAARLRERFWILVGGDQVDNPPDADELGFSRLLEAPSPALLHAYIRALGWMGDYQGLVETVHWMAKHRHELAERRGRDRNGETVMRRAITALRVFLERSWIAATEDREKVSDAELEEDNLRTRLVSQTQQLETPARESVIREVEELVESVEDWWGWATDEEVGQYCQHRRFQELS